MCMQTGGKCRGCRGCPRGYLSDSLLVDNKYDYLSEIDIILEDIKFDIAIIDERLMVLEDKNKLTKEEQDEYRDLFQQKSLLQQNLQELKGNSYE